jgi:alpha,alpha-trehalase
MSDDKYQILGKKYDAVIFDLDGVVTRTAHIHAAAWKDLFDEYLKKHSEGETFEPFDSDADYLTYVDGKPRYDGVKSFLASRDIEIPSGKADDSADEETVCGLGNRKNGLFLERLKREGVEVYDTTIDLIARLRKKGFKTAIISSSKNCANILDAAGITGLFDASVDGVESETLDLAGKPAPDIFLEAARRLEVDPERCVIFEDAISGVQAGSKGGFGLVVGVDRADQSKALKEEGADLVVKDMGAVGVGIEIKELACALESFEAIKESIRGKEVVVFLDYDGTLTRIVPRPEDALLSEKMREILIRLAAQCTVAVVSGRGLKDVKKRVDIDDLYYAGSHGFEIEGTHGLKMEHDEAKGFLHVLDDAEANLIELLSDIQGAQVERKKFSIAVHYRNVDEDETATVEGIVNHTIEQYPALRKSFGKKVYDLRPDMDWGKGKAITWLMDALDLELPGVIPFYLGDDLTDEDAFRTLELKGTGIVVGEGSRGTAASYRLENTDQVMDFLKQLVLLLEEGSTWSLVYKEYKPDQEKLREALCTLGNGYFATRGAAAEHEAGDFHYPGTYLAGGYNRLKTEMAGRTIENEDLVNMPNWLCLNFRILGEEWFNLDEVDILSYRQELDIKKGCLCRRIRFRDKKGRETRLITRRLVHMGHMHLAAMETTLIPLNWSATLEIGSVLDGRVTNSGVRRYQELNNKHLEAVETSKIDENTVLLKVRTSQSRLMIAQAAKVDVFREKEKVSLKTQVVEDAGYIALHFTVTANQQEPLLMEKTMSMFTSRDLAISECALEAEKELADAPRFNELLRTHALAWKHLWEKFELKIDLRHSDNDHQIQRTLRLYTFHMLQSASMHSLDIDVGMPARGWHGEAYRGHVFWDEIIIFPFLNYRAPHITRTLLMYRYRRLKEAKRAAREHGYKGAMYPWQSASNGREETQQVHLNPESGRWIPDNSHRQRHINAAIVYNIWQYYQASGDLEFLSFYGAEMIFEIARFWESIAVYNEADDRYDISGVMGPDEYHDAYPGAETPGLNNNAYTNVMTAFVINRAIEMIDLLPDEQIKQLCEKLDIEQAEIEKWQNMAAKLRVVFHDDGIISQFQEYDKLAELDWEKYRRKYGNIQRLDRILEAEDDTANRYKLSKQPDVLMLFYLFSAETLGKLFKQMGYNFEYETIPKNTHYYSSRTSNGSSLSYIIHAWVMARLDRKRSWKLFQSALKTDVADIQGGTTPEGIHLAAMSGCVDIIQRAYTGLEIRENVLILNPQFPDEIEGIKFHLRYRNHWLELDITCDRIKIHAPSSGADSIRIKIKEQDYELEQGKTLEVSLGKNK